MATLHFNNIGIRAMAACVPKTIAYNKDLTWIPEKDLAKTIQSIGVRERRIADKDKCASDYCIQAAKQLFKDNAIQPTDINALIFVSQTPDYHQPATSPWIQHTLGLPKTTLCFDVNLACSGYVYGLSIAYAYASVIGVDNVLLLVGETMSKVVSDHDKVATPLFADAGTATLVSKGEYGETIFSLNTDGSGSDVIKMPNGGYRNPSTAEGLIPQEDEDGNIRSKEQFYMNGMDVFNFGMREEPRDIKNLMKMANINNDDLDLLIYHQANKFMTDFFSKYLKIPQEKTPYSIDRFGNTSSASIPLTIVTELAQGYPKRKNVILSGFGAGLSWGSTLVDLSLCNISNLIEL